MATGVVISANNTLSTKGLNLDYISLARANAKNIRKFLNVPVCLLTDEEGHGEGFDEVVIHSAAPAPGRSMIKGNEIFTYAWKNDTRIGAYELTPFDRTLMVDADYLILTDDLKQLLEVDVAFTIPNDVYDVTGRNTYHHARRLPLGGIPQTWATMMYWQQCKEAESVFLCAEMVRENYEYYSMALGVPSTPFRNDYAFSVAAWLTKTKYYPTPIPTLPADSTIIGCNPSTKSFLIRYPEHPMSGLVAWNKDLHVINKDVVMDPNYLKMLRDINEH